MSNPPSNPSGGGGGGWSLPTQTKSTAPKPGSGAVSSLASLYPQMVTPNTGTNAPPVLAYAGFSQAAKRAAAAAAAAQQQSQSQSQSQTQIGQATISTGSGGGPTKVEVGGGQAIPPTIDYPVSTLMQGQKTIVTNTQLTNQPSTNNPLLTTANTTTTPPMTVTPNKPTTTLQPSTTSPVPPLSSTPRTGPTGPIGGGSTNLSIVPPSTVTQPIKTTPFNRNLSFSGTMTAAGPSPSPSPAAAMAMTSSGMGTSLGAASSFSNPSFLQATSSSLQKPPSLLNSGLGLAATTSSGQINSLFSVSSSIGGVGAALQLQAQQIQTQQQKVSLDVGQPLNALTCSPDRTHLAVGGKEVKIIQHINGKFIPVKHLNTNSKTPTALSDIQWHPLEAFKYWLVTAPTNGKILLYNLNSKEGLKRSERILDDHERTVNRIVWHPNQGEILFSGSQDGTVKMFDLRNPSSKCVQSFQDVHSVRDVQVNPFNQNIFAAAYENGSMQIWDVRKGQYFHTINAHQGLILTLDWHPEDANILASGGVDRAIKVWHIGASVDKTMGIHSTPASNNPSQASSAAASPSSSSSSTNQTEPLHTIQTIASVGRVKWRPSNKYHFQIASAANLMDCKIHLWNVHKPFVPMVSLLGHKDVISGFYWSDLDSKGQLGGMEIISCSKDSTIQQNFLSIDHQSNPNYHLTQYPNETLRTSSISWNIKGDIAIVNDYIDRTVKIRQPDPTISTPFSFTAYNPALLSSATVSGGTGNVVQSALKPNSIQSAVLASILGANTPVEALRNGFIRVFHGATSQQPLTLNAAGGRMTPTLDHTRINDPDQSGVPTLTEEEAFVHFARNYKFTANQAYSSALKPSTFDSSSPTFVTLALHNAEVARTAYRFKLSQIWRVLIQLLGPGSRRKEIEPTGPPPLPMDEHSVQAKLKSDGSAAGANTGSNTVNSAYPPVTYVPAQFHNPSTVLHHRQTTHTINDVTRTDTTNGPTATVSPHQQVSPDGHDDLVSQYLQIQLLQPLASRPPSYSDITSLERERERLEQKTKEAQDTLSPSPPLVTRSSSDALSPGSSGASSSPNAATSPRRRILDPTQTVSSLNRQQVLVDCLPTIHKSHCYTLQNPSYTPGSGLQPYLPNPYNSALSILSSSAFQATLLNSFLEYSIERGDVQTCVAVVSLLKEFHPDVITAMEKAEADREQRTVGGAIGHTIPDRFKHWYYSYIDLLQRHELYSHASEIIQLCNDTDLKKMNQKSTTISLICPVCKHASQQVGIGCTNKMCTKTRMTNCSLCQLPVTGVYVWCQGCGHGGHMAHMQGWFEKHSFCPTGCLHRCVELVTSAQQQKQ